MSDVTTGFDLIAGEFDDDSDGLLVYIEKNHGLVNQEEVRN